MNGPTMNDPNPPRVPSGGPGDVVTSPRPLHKRLWFLEQLGLHDGYFTPRAVRLRGHLDLPALSRAVDELRRRHPELRERCVDRDGVPQMVPDDSVEPVLHFDHAGTRAETAAERLLDAVAGPAAGHSFAAALATLAPDDRVLLLAVHQAAGDPAALSALAGELGDLYSVFLHGEPADTAAHDSGTASRGAAATPAPPDTPVRALAEEALDVPHDRARPRVWQPAAATVPFTLPAGFGGERPAVALLAAVHTLLARHGGRWRGVLGFREGTGAVRPVSLALGPAMTGTAAVEHAAAEAARMAGVDAEDLARAAEADLSRNPLYGVLVEAVDEGPAVFGPLTAERLPVHARSTRHDLTVRLRREADGRLLGELEYATALFTSEAATRLADRLSVLCAGAPEQPLGRRDMLTPAELREALPPPRATADPLPDRPVAHLVVAAARANPDAVALECDGERLTYGQLAGRGEALARRLREEGVRPGELVAVLMPRGTALLPTLLGIHLAGAAYLPLDPEHPRERLALVLSDAGARFLVTAGSAAADLPADPGLTVLDHDSVPAPGDGRPASGDTGSGGHASLDDPAYVIYTSGSTGRPKGVMVTHRSLLAFLWSMRERPGLEPGAVFPAVTTVAFDIAALELFLPLLTGGRVVLGTREETRDPGRLAALLARTGARVMQATPATWRLLLDAGWTPPPGFVALSGGERLPEDQARRLCAAGARLWDLYGPTETTVWSSAAALRDGVVTDFAAVAGTTLYVLDERLEPMPAGCTGELYIGGAGVALGYLGRGALTAGAFLPDPYGGVPGARMYRTGDLARRHTGGRVEILGRTDDQLKIRGVRVEPGEAEAALARCPGVRAAVVRAAPGPDGRPWLVGYVTPAHAGQPPTADVLRAHCARLLPAAMIPARFVVLDEFPLTPNGKVDARALSALAERAPSGAAAGREPKTDLERLVAKAFAEVLDRPGIAAGDDFFVLGGDSLLAVRAVSKLRSWSGRDLPLSDFFEARTVEALALRLERHTGDGPALVPAEHTGPRPLSFAQRRLWFLHRLDPRDVSYNEPLAVPLPGPFRRERLYEALDELFARHENLRGRYQATEDGDPVQIVEEPPALRPEPEPGDPVEVLAAELTRPFDLSEAPPVRVRVVRAADGTHTVVFALHHIATDDRSNEIIARDLTALYQGRRPPLPPVRYADWALWQRERMTGERRLDELRYWREQLDALEPTELLTDRPRPAVRDARAATVRVDVPAELAGRLRTLGENHGATLFITLLAGYLALLARYTGRDDLAVGVPVSGRDRPETEQVVGLFVNTVVLRVAVPSGDGFRELIGRTRDSALAAYRHAELPFDLVVEELAPHRELSRGPLFGTLFTLHEEPSAALAATPPPAGAKADLACHVTKRSDGGLDCALTYAGALFDEAVIAGFAERYVRLLQQAVTAPDTPVGRLPLTQGPEPSAIGEHRTPAGRDEPDTVQELIAVHRDGVAVTDGAQSLTYPELDGRANRLAHRLRDLGVGRGDRVAVLLPRGIDLVVALLAVLKAGAAYVPLDPAHPARRSAGAVADAGAALLLTSTSAEPVPGVRRLAVDDPRERALVARAPATPPHIRLTADDLAYVCYTSGSTGRPKGVMVTHGGLVNYTRWARDTLPFRSGPAGTVLHTSVAHDLALTSLYPALAAGVPLRLADPASAGVQGLADALPEGPYGVLKLTPTHLDLLTRTVEPAALAGAVGCLVVGGEELRGEQLAAWARHAPDLLVVNSYGPTEATVACLTHTIRAGGVAPGAVPLGRPITGVSVHLLDDALNPVPPGAPGEIYVGGAGVARGYAGAPRATADRFVPDPFATRPGARLYRTGDLARRSADGTLVFLGRRDQQLKINGYRVEPGEIETLLAGHPAVRAAVVTADHGDPSGPRIAAHVVPAAGRLDEDGLAALRAHLAQRLPGHLVPALWSVLDALPLLRNGKVDRRALPEARPLRATGQEYIAPATAAERTIAAVWSEVLGIERIGAHDSFFTLGGQSLLATRVAGRLDEKFPVPVLVRDVFSAPTVARLARLLAARAREQLEEVFGASSPSAQEETGAVDPAPPAHLPGGPTGGVKAVPRDGALPLSFAQRRLWFHEQMNPGGVEYLVTTALRLRGPLDPGRLARALDEVVARHEALRTRYPADAEGDPVQVIDPPAPVPLPVREVTESTLTAALEAELTEPISLDAGPLLRARLLRLAADEHVLVLVAHHIAVDGWSNDILTAELAAAYRGDELPPPAVQYADFAAWQNERLTGPVTAQLLAHWRERLAGAQPTELPADRRRPARRDPRGAVHRFTVPAAAVAPVEELASRTGVTPFTAWLAVFYVLLARHTGRTDLSVGVPVAGREHGSLENVVGCFVNTLVYRADLAGDPSFTELLRKVAELSRDAGAHGELPFEQLVEHLAPPRDPARHPLFQVLFAFRERGGTPFALPGVEVTREEVPSRTAKFDLTLELTRNRDGGLSGEIEYASALFDATTVERLARHYGRLVERAGAAPRARIGELEMLGDAERISVLRDAAGPVVPRPAEGLPELIARQAARTPAHDAVVSDEGRLTYAELDARADRLAHRLRALGVGPGRPVGVCLPRRPELVVALLAVLRAGGVYLPLAPEGPAARNRDVLDDAGAEAVLTHGDPAPSWAGGCRVLDLAAGLPDSDGRPGNPAPLVTDPDELAYIIYTSGSTGRPKGVGVPHRGIRNRVLWAVQQFGLGARDRFLQKTTVTFDASVWEFLAPLVSGGTVVLAPPGAERDPAELVGAVVRHEATVLQGVPSFYRLLAEEPGLDRCHSLRLVFSAGEPLTRDLAARLSELLPSATLVNTYGPTESSIDATFWTVVPETGPGATDATVPIGLPLDNCRALVRTADGAPAPIGVPGELYLSGDGLARGYVGRPGLTAAHFLPDPYGPPGSRAYRTGDLVRLRADGVLEHLGRIDDQLKIRGVRIEPAEIEAVLSRHPAVAAVAVAAHPDPDGRPQLVGYVQYRQAAPRDEEALRDFLRAALPETHVPSRIVRLDALPLTSSGKTDRAALPAPGDVPSAGTGGSPPRTRTERLVAEVMAEVLGRASVGRDDDFFRIGGHSLLAMRVAGRLRSLGIGEVSVRALFEHPTVAGLAGRLDGARGRDDDAVPVLAPALRHRPHPLSAEQRRLWLLNRIDPLAYLVTWALRLTGPLDREALEGALGDLVARHEILRTRYGTQPDGTPHQIVEPPAPVALRVTEVTGAPDPESGERAGWLRETVRRRAVRPVDLAAGPPLAAHLLRLGPTEHLFVLALHHIATDGVSEEILGRELAELYAARRTRRPAALAPLGLQYLDYAVWQHARPDGEDTDRGLRYWRDRLAGLRPPQLPADLPRPGTRDGAGALLGVRLPADVAGPLLDHGRGRGATPFMTFLAVLVTLLHRFGCGADLAVGVPVSGRVRPGLEDVVGFFANTVVARVRLGDDPEWTALLDRVRDTALDAFDHGDVPFDRVVGELAPDRDAGRPPFFDVMLEVTDAVPGAPALPGLGAERIRLAPTRAKFGLTVFLTARPDGGYDLELEYATALFSEDRVRRLAEHFVTLARAAARQPGARISRLALLEPGRRAELLAASTGEPVPDFAGGLPEAFAEQAERTPGAPAVVGADGSVLSYAELARRSARLAERLVAAGVRPEDPVAVCLDRSPDTVVAMLGVLRSGGVYVPLGSEQPAVRLSVMLDDLSPAAVVTEPRLEAGLGTGAAPVLTVTGAEDASEATTVALPPSDPDRLAYMIYTSGSTGRPKAVMVPHRAYLHHCRVALGVTGLGPGDRGVLLSAPTFDLAMEQMGVPLITGAAVAISDVRFWPPSELADRLHAAEVRQVFLTPAYYREVMDHVRPGDRRFDGVRRLFAGGEAVTYHDARRWYGAGLPGEFVCAYGPTEATIVCLTYPVPRGEPDVTPPDATVPVGRPVPGSRTYVLDAGGDLAPVGVVGELCVAGPRLSRGYLRLPRLTADRFVPDPFGPPGSRLYRTGDLARYRRDGVIEFIGRIDGQVKLRGFRIELGEIEAALATHPGVRAAAVTAYGEGEDRRLAAYVVPREGAGPEPAALREHLRDRLPEYMIPAVWTTLGELPLNSSKKVDRRRLPAPDLTAATVEDETTGPADFADEVEEAIAGAWAEVLGTAPPSRDTGFFELGAHSLTATRLLTRLEEMFGLSIPLRVLFDATSVRAQAAALEELATAQDDDHAAHGGTLTDGSDR